MLFGLLGNNIRWQWRLSSIVSERSIISILPLRGPGIGEADGCRNEEDLGKIKRNIEIVIRKGMICSGSSTSSNAEEGSPR